jgi:hypothetical protein
MSKCSSAILVFVLGACVPQPGAQFRGLWTLEGDGAVFQPCGASERWLASLDSTLLKEAVVETTMVFIADGGDKAALRPPPLPPPTFIVLRGDTSPAGSFGSKGQYTRQLLVHALGDTTGECP